MDEYRLVVTYDPEEEGRAILGQALADSVRLTFLPDIPQSQRARVLSTADILLSWIPERELSPEEFGELGRARFMQLFSAGADQVPFANLPSGLKVASNVGAYAEPMAEHVLAMTLALAKRLPVEHERLRRGEFNQGTQNRSLRGASCGILGFGA